MPIVQPYTVQRTKEFRDWLRDLKDRTSRDSIVVRLVRMQSGLLGNVEPVGGKVSEAKVDVGPGYRVYFTRRGAALIILLCGGDKGTQARDIAKAKAMVAELDKEAKAAAKKK